MLYLKQKYFIDIHKYMCVEFKTLYTRSFFRSKNC